jgi:F0F1-type ATP synthase membrane subunit b/b'
MRARLAGAVVITGLLFCVPLTRAQEGGSKVPAKSGEGESEVSPVWAWANFAILAAALGYLIVKKGGPWFASRTYAIRKGIAEAEDIRADAEARAEEVDRRLAGLAAEIEALRHDARSEQAAEAERIRQQTVIDLARIQEHATREIDAAGKASRIELKRYAARLSVGLAEQKIRRQINPALRSELVENFVHDLDHPPTGSHLSK